jgi:hypothetical protein
LVKAFLFEEFLEVEVYYTINPGGGNEIAEDD